MKRSLIIATILLSAATWVVAQDKRHGLTGFDRRLPTPTPQPGIVMIPHMLHSAKLVKQSDAVEQQRDEVADRDGWGPTRPGHDLSDVDVVQLEKFYDVDLRQLCRYSLVVYPDANPNSGIFYYRPARFALKFEPPDFYLSIEYKASTTDGENVLMQAQLTPGADKADRTVLDALLEAYLEQRGLRVRDPYLMPLPVTYEADFQLQHWNIEDVAVNGVDPDTGEIQITLSADVPTKELVTSTLGNINGLTGHVDLRPVLINPDRQNFTEPIQLVANIRLPDALGGPAPRWRQPVGGIDVDFVNEWPFEMELEYLAYLIEDGGELTLRGWDLGGATLGSGDTARTTVLALNKEVTSDDVITALYLGDLRRDDDVVESVLERLTSGVGQLPIMQVEIYSLNPEALFDQFNIHKLVVELRSAHFDPDGREVVSNTYDLEGFGDRLLSDPLHLWDDSGDLYHYRIVVVTRDGSVFSDPGWRAPNPQLLDEIMVGSRQIEEVLAQ